ncbi:MAG: cytidylate kinase-like family protein, partial [Firmicutes bacterium]|nr:cytidylate kinase-like family protein [Bacillota bacterium]
DQLWGMAENYDLCLNSSKLGIDRCVELILASLDKGIQPIVKCDG